MSLWRFKVVFFPHVLFLRYGSHLKMAHRENKENEEGICTHLTLKRY